MNEMSEEQLGSLLDDLAIYSLAPALGALRGRTIPASRPLAAFMADFSAVVAYYLAEELMTFRKTSILSRQPPAVWVQDVRLACGAFGIWLVTDLSEANLLVTGRVGDHFRGVFSGTKASALIAPRGEVEFPLACAITSGVVSDCSDRAAVKLNEDSLRLSVHLAAMVKPVLLTATEFVRSTRGVSSPIHQIAALADS